HAPAAIWAMQAGKDVYVEKPVSHNLAEGRMLAECARKTGRICQAGTQARSSQPTREIIDRVRSGKIGDVRLARGICHRRRKAIGPRGTYEPPSVVDYNLWLGPAPNAPVTRPQFHYDWHWQWPYGSGDLGNQGIHEMDIARWGLGVEHSRRVFSYGGRLAWDDAGDTANTQVVVHEFGEKTLVFEVRNLPAGPVDGCSGGVVFYGTEGRAIVHGYRGGKITDLDGNVVEEFERGDDISHRRNFLTAVRSRRREDLNAEILEGHLSAALVHAGNISYRIGERMPAAEVKEILLRDYAKETREDLASGFARMENYLKANALSPEATELTLGPVLSLDAATETFGVPAADALLSREYRRPFVPIV
ncbi:gfo/Idh/MocA family oxidoreductase, partial [Candidatus Peregrinibacteria bacterium]|nr:gfo/Idh/MocA family oxidoreductase [Candidatus Peregrinibacteria bacterium]